MLLQYDKVAAHLGVGTVDECIVWQAQSGNEVGTLHQLHSDKRAFAVHHSLRCYESDNAALTNRVKTFEEEIIMYSRHRFPVSYVVTGGIHRIRHGDITERDIRCRDIKIIFVIGIQFLEALYMNVGLRVQFGQYQPCQCVLLKRNPLATGIYPCESVHKGTAPRAGVEEALRFHSRLLQSLGYGFNNVLRGIVGGKHGRFQRVHVTLKLPVIL